MSISVTSRSHGSTPRDLKVIKMSEGEGEEDRCKIGKLCGTAAIPSRAVPCIIGMGRQMLPVRPFRRFRSAKVNSCCLE